MDFSKAKFDNNAHFFNVQFHNEAIFSEALFNNSANFGHSMFKKKADFYSAKFFNVATVDFSYAKFDNKAIFCNAQFISKAYFVDVQFDNEANFSDAQFNEEVMFTSTHFNNKAVFSLVKFNNIVYFTGTVFNNIAYFSEARFNKAEFSGAEFKDETSFSKTDFMDDVFFINTKFHVDNERFIDFQYSKFHKQKDVRFQDVDLCNVSFLNTDITDVEFLEESWAKKNGRLIVADEIWVGEDGGTTYSAVAQLYRRLRRNYETNYRFAEAGDFFIGEMEMRRLDVNTRFKNEKVRMIILWFKRNCSLLGIYKHLSLYGESYVRPAILSIIIIIFYPMLMHSLFNVSLVDQFDDFIYTNIKKSAASFFQMDSTYVGERLVGIPILGLLFIALKRKFERKK